MFVPQSCRKYVVLHFLNSPTDDSCNASRHEQKHRKNTQVFILYHLYPCPTSHISDGWHFPPACSAASGKAASKSSRVVRTVSGSEGWSLASSPQLKDVKDRRSEPNLQLMVHFLVDSLRKGNHLVVFLTWHSIVSTNLSDKLIWLITWLGAG